MSDRISSDNEPEPELTDEARQVIGKARRSFGLSMGILMLGLLAVAGALVYRVSRTDEATDRYALEQIVVPQGAEVLAIVPDGSLLAVTYRLDGQTHFMLLNGSDGTVVEDIPVVEGAGGVD